LVFNIYYTRTNNFPSLFYACILCDNFSDNRQAISTLRRVLYHLFGDGTC